MRKLWMAPALILIALASPARAVTTVDVVPGSPPVLLLPNQSTTIDIELLTDEIVGGVHIFFTATADVTIAACNNPGLGAAFTFSCTIDTLTDQSAELIVSELNIAGMSDMLHFVSVTLDVGNTLGLGTFELDMITSTWSECPGYPCVAPTPQTFDGPPGGLLAVVAPEPSSAALLALGLGGLAYGGRRRLA